MVEILLICVVTIANSNLLDEDESMRRKSLNNFSFFIKISVKLTIS